jgi:hypothetical protein
MLIQTQNEPLCLKDKPHCGIHQTRQMHDAYAVVTASPHAQQTLLINHFRVCMWPLSSPQHSTPGDHYNQQELAPELKPACHTS